MGAASDKYRVSNINYSITTAALDDLGALRSFSLIFAIKKQKHFFFLKLENVAGHTVPHVRPWALATLISKHAIYVQLKIIY